MKANLHSHFVAIALVHALLPGSAVFIPSTANAGIIFQDNFNSGTPALQWGNEVGSWSISGGKYSASGGGSTFPNAHSSLPFVLIDFTIELDITDVDDGGVWLRSTTAPGTNVGRTGVLLVTGGSGHTGTGLYWHVVTDPSTYGSAFSAVSGLFVSDVSDPHLKIVVSGNTYSAYVNGAASPATTLTTSAFASGRVALYDYSAVQTFDNVVLSTLDVIPEPASLASWSVLLVGLALASRRRSSRR